VLNLWRSWWEDPVASSTIMIALAGGLFAVYQLRAVPGERRRRILDAMVKQYGDTLNARRQILGECPMLLKLAYQAVKSAVDAEVTLKEQSIQLQDAEAAAVADLELRHLSRLQREATIWLKPDIGISYTSAAEILSSEFKFRALIWCIEVLREPSLRHDAGFNDELIALCASLVAELNNFALDYENGTYPPRTLLGQLHRSIAPTVKALEPIIWERSLSGRWGRRVLRLGLAAQHYNDVVKIHRSTDLVWLSAISPRGGKVVVHPAKTINIFGQEILRADIPRQPRVLPLVRLQLQTFYWWLVGNAAFRPSSTLWAYGGARLRRHQKQEDHLSACIRYGLDHLRAPGRLLSLSFTWNLGALREDMVRTAKERKSALRGGPISWIYQRNTSR
jgi:hypothetical protein